MPTIRRTHGTRGSLPALQPEVVPAAAAGPALPERRGRRFLDENSPHGCDRHHEDHRQPKPAFRAHQFSSRTAATRTEFMPCQSSAVRACLVVVRAHIDALAVPIETQRVTIRILATYLAIFDGRVDSATASREDGQQSLKQTTGISGFLGRVRPRRTGRVAPPPRAKGR
jgi:hypothetical protein